MTVEQLLEEAKMLRKTWCYQEALASYEQALQRDRNCIAAHQGRCAMLRELGRRQEALLAYDELLRLDPQSTNPWVGKAWALVDLRRYEEVLAAFDHALQLASSLGTAVSGKRSLEANWAVLDFGALVCRARRPRCQECPLRTRCEYARSLKLQPTPSAGGR